MKLPEVCVYKENWFGFTVIEIMFVLAIFVVLASVLTPLALNFYRSEQLDAHTNGIVQALRRAQAKSMSSELDSTFGVRFEEEQYILFKGISYLKRETAYDEVFNLPEGFSLAGLSEIVFNQLEGVPSDDGNITLAVGNQSAVISVNEMGVIHY